MTLTIEDDIPLPIIPVGIHAQLLVGQSFFVAGEKTLPRGKALAAAYMYGRNHGWEISARNVVENGVAGVRIWRVK